MMPKLRIYVAGPYTAADEEQRAANVIAAMDAGIHLLRLGHTPYIPHLTHFVDLRSSELGISFDWEDYLSWDLDWLKMCDAILYLGSSQGADRELAAARRWGKMIFRSLDEVRQESSFSHSSDG